MAADRTINLPSGSITHVLTDIEHSARSWEQSPKEMQATLAAHDEIARDVIGSHHGVMVKHLGDGCWAVFRAATDAAAAAVELQRRLQLEAGAHDGRLTVRIGLHTGLSTPVEGDYFGTTINRARRVADLANGDQIVCSSSTAGVLTGFELRDMGHRELRGIGTDQIFLLLADGVRSDDRPLRSPVATNTLPTERTKFIGRHEELRLGARYLAGDDAVLTFVGPGGVGKTRLAVEVANEFSETWTGEIRFCDLMPVGDRDGLMTSVADEVGARLQPGLSWLESIVDYLSTRRVLLILDTCEHLVEEVAELVERVTAGSETRVIATSREGLALAGEQVLIVAPLPPESAGVELFVDRAKHRDPGFELTADNERDVGEVVRGLDGIPLAVELAAARVRLMTPRELSNRLGDRFRALGRARRRDRFETLHQTLSWSYNLLSPAEAALFRQLCVFAGGFDLAAVETVCRQDESIDSAEIPDLLLALVDKSMVVSREVDGNRRFSLLETLRRFSEDTLGTGQAVEDLRRRHADYFRHLAVEQGGRVFTAAEPDAWWRLDVDWVNLRTAFDTYQRTGQLDEAAELVTALVWYSTFAMRFELFGWADELLASQDIDEHPSFADLCGAAAFGAYFTVQGDTSHVAGRGLEADPSDPQGFCRAALAAVFLNNVHSAADSDRLTSEWLATNPTSPGSRMWAEGFRTFHLALHGPQDEAAFHAAASMRFADATGSQTARAVADWSAGLVATHQSVERAIEIWTAALEWPRSVRGGHLLEHLLLGLILNFRVSKADLHDSAVMCRDALTGALDDHYYVGASHLLGVTAITLTRADDAPTGARLIGSMISHGHLPRPNALTAVERALGDDLQHHLDLGSTLSVSQSAQLALESLDALLDRSVSG